MIIRWRVAWILVLNTFSFAWAQPGKDPDGPWSFKAKYVINACLQAIGSQLWDKTGRMSSRIEVTCPDHKLAEGDSVDSPILIHASKWKFQDGVYDRISSEWQVYRPQNKSAAGASVVALLKTGLSSRGKTAWWDNRPALYGDKSVWIFAIAEIDGADPLDCIPAKACALKSLDLAYSVSEAKITSEREQDFAALAKALFGAVTVGGGPLNATIARPPDHVCLNCLVGAIRVATIDLPAQLTLSVKATVPTAESGDGAAPVARAAKADPAASGSTDKPPSSADCSAVSAKAACTTTRTLENYDKEFWDIALAIATPGVLEPNYASSNPAKQLGPTRHTDLYGMLNFYPFYSSFSKDSILPHLVAGIPVTSKPFYRPFFGVAENLTGWTRWQKHGFPLRMSFFAGVVYLNEETVIGNGSGGLSISHARTLKPMAGIEVPLSGLVSKIGSLGGASKGGAAK